VNSVAVGSIDGIHRYKGWLIVTDAGAVRCKDVTTAAVNFTLLDTITAGRPRFADIDDFTFIANGTDRKAFTEGALYNWNIENPTGAPSGAAGAGGTVAAGSAAAGGLSAGTIALITAGIVASFAVVVKFSELISDMGQNF